MQPSLTNLCFARPLFQDVMTISMTSYWLTLAVFAAWPDELEQQVKNFGFKKHGYGSLLRDKGLATTPQRASATNFLHTARQLFCVVS